MTHVPASSTTCIYCDEPGTCYPLTPCGHKWCDGCLVVNYDDSLNRREPLLCNPKDGNRPKCLSVVSAEFMESLTLTPMYSQMYEKILTKAFWKKFKSQDCPGCKYACIRMNNKDQRVECARCKVNFCFYCTKPWSSCGNKDCKDDPILLSLKTCGEKIIMAGSTQVSAPKLRMCPNCSSAFEHKERCKHVTCSNCKKSFCWFCLSLSPYPKSCGDHTTACAVAPTQTDYSY